MVGVNDIVITGIGCVTPIGIGREAFTAGLLEQRCAIRRLHLLRGETPLAIYGASVDEFDGKQYVTPRKALKVMSREVQMAYSAAHLAWRDACLTNARLEPDRMGVIYGSEMMPGDISDMVPAVRACCDDDGLDLSRWGQQFLKEIYPLWMLKNLPNMPACHVGIAIDARGPNNTIAHEEVSGLLALAEAAMVIEREQADLMIVGAIGSRVIPARLMYRPYRLYDQHPMKGPEDNCAPAAAFDSRRRGIVPGEAAVAVVLERRSHAIARGAEVLAVVAGQSSRFAPPKQTFAGSREAIAAAAMASLEEADVAPAELDHISAQGYAEHQLDIEEAQAIAAVAPDVPVTAFSSYFGTSGAACGLLELTASLLANRCGRTLPTLGFSQADPDCPVRVLTKVTESRQPSFLKLSFTPHGQAAAVVVRCMK